MSEKQDFLQLENPNFYTKDQIMGEYGRVSFAYTQINEEGKYYVVAISRLNEAFLKVYLGIEKIDYVGIEYTYKLEPEYAEVV